MARHSTLQYQETSTISLKSCIERYSHVPNSELYPDAKNLNSKFICTLNQPGKGLCIGDIGNPLVSNDELIGIASWCVECSSTFPNVYTNVYSHLDWINKNMEN